MNRKQTGLINRTKLYETATHSLTKRISDLEKLEFYVQKLLRAIQRVENGGLDAAPFEGVPASRKLTGRSHALPVEQAVCNL